MSRAPSPKHFLPYFKPTIPPSAPPAAAEAVIMVTHQMCGSGPTDLGDSKDIDFGNFDFSLELLDEEDDELPAYDTPKQKISP